MMADLNKISLSDKQLIISSVDNAFRRLFLIFWIFLLSSSVLLYYTPFQYSVLIFFILVALMSIYWHRLRIPANFWPVSIRKEENLIFVNKRQFLLEDLLFLSFYETEGYTIIRLEARRNNILFPREVRLISNCSGYEEAVHLCRQIRDFIDPDLKINHIRSVSGKSKPVGWRGSGKIQFDKWEFIE